MHATAADRGIEPTVEPRPCIQNYLKNLRPTLEDLHNPTYSKALSNLEESNGSENTAASSSPQPVKLGWIQGVYIRSLLNIWGVMLFLRMGWMVGHAGVGLSVLIVLLSTVITVITTLSMSAICTNGKIAGGGAYYLVSRNLGPQIGGAVGAMFSFANCIAVSMYVVGAAEAVHDIMLDHGVSIFVNGLNDIRLISCAILVILLLVTFIGLDFESKTQLFLLGFLGWSWRLGIENWSPDFRDGTNFFTVFSIFFPSVIGILAGANISGDLKDPGFAIPRGTLWAISTTSLSYLTIIAFLGFTLVRDASGLVEELESGLFLDCFGRPCPYGMLNNYQMMSVSAAFGPVIYVGIFAATLSSALAALISAPRLIQAFAKDNIFPFLGWLSRGYGPNENPHIATLCCFALSLLFVLMGNLNAIAPIISNFFMATYGMINFACFLASYGKSPGFRPSFRFFNQWLSLLGAVLCILAMFVMNWIMALVTVTVALAFYGYLARNRPDINWGTSTQAIHFKNTLDMAHIMNTVEDHVKNYRPCILVLSGSPCTRAPLVDLAAQITKDGTGLLICGHVLSSNQHRNYLTDINTRWLEKRKIKGFYVNIESPSFMLGSHSLMQAAGLGKMKPNIVMLGFPTEWRSDLKASKDYVAVLHHVLDLHLGLMVLRLQRGLGISHLVETPDQIPLLPVLDPNSHIVPMDGADKSSKIPDWVLPALDQFQRTQQQGTVDIWWLYDDGGLTLLVPYLLSQRQLWKSCRVRVMVPADSHNQLAASHLNMASLLKCFRIGISDILPVQYFSTSPSPETQQAFKDLVDPIEELTPEILETHQDKSLRQMKVRDLLKEYSSEAALIIATLPLPRKGSCPESLYLAWLDLLTKDLPPCLLIRGNQDSVLTLLA
ncbi:SLC12A1 [Cordylochernes scorpioides]|uniref:SLC12A1 n=1 Tax=Cordylochernes scorpioides TaxID=51811 RepID=A0ABY6LE19_9ARAC|nr:SLC12A1 [Cordylochernes scorpioides]